MATSTVVVLLGVEQCQELKFDLNRSVELHNVMRTVYQKEKLHFLEYKLQTLKMDLLAQHISKRMYYLDVRRKSTYYSLAFNTFKFNTTEAALSNTKKKYAGYAKGTQIRLRIL